MRRRDETMTSKGTPDFSLMRSYKLHESRRARRSVLLRTIILIARVALMNSDVFAQAK